MKGLYTRWLADHPGVINCFSGCQILRRPKRIFQLIAIETYMLSCCRARRPDGDVGDHVTEATLRHSSALRPGGGAAPRCHCRLHEPAPSLAAPATAAAFALAAASASACGATQGTSVDDLIEWFAAVPPVES